MGGSFHTALHAVAHQGHEKAVDMLLEAGADVGIAGGKYGSALDAATANGQANVMDRLRKAERVRGDADTIEVSKGANEVSKIHYEVEVDEIATEGVEADEKPTAEAHINELETDLIADFSLSAGRTTTLLGTPLVILTPLEENPPPHSARLEAFQPAQIQGGEIQEQMEGSEEAASVKTEERHAEVAKELALFADTAELLQGAILGTSHKVTTEELSVKKECRELYSRMADEFVDEDR